MELNKNFTRSQREVIEFEHENYLRQRRFKVGLTHSEDEKVEEVVGLSISGGGVRAATLGLGMIQLFITKGIFKRFDYMSTVSGGGYIGSCLSSLMTAEFDGKQGLERDANSRYRVEHIGVEADNSPLINTGRAKNEYQTLEKSQLSGWSQVNHLRTHGEYLTPDKGLFSWDVMSAVGTLLVGALTNLSLFVLALALIIAFHHFLFVLISANTFFQDIKVSYNPGTNISEMLGNWLYYRVGGQIYNINMALRNSSWTVGLFCSLGYLTGAIATFKANRYPLRVYEAEEAESEGKMSQVDPNLERDSGYEIQDLMFGNFISTYKLIAFAAGPVLAYLFVIYERLFSQQLNYDKHTYLIIMGLPVFFALGLCVATFTIPQFLSRYEQVSGRLYRYVFTGMQGASIYGVVIAFFIPLLLIMVFSNELTFSLLLSSIPLVGSSYWIFQNLGRKTSEINTPSFFSKYWKPILTFSLFIFLGLLFSWISDWFKSYNWVETHFFFGHALQIDLFAFYVMFWSIVAFVCISYMANVNDLSMHYFYRDRLSEAYLRTDARVLRPTSSQVELQGMPMVNLRNHENLLISKLGDGNGRGPYHIIVAALNLQGSNDLVRRSTKSDHFIFSKYFIGSRSTGYMSSEHYRGNSTKLSQAMTISAAAVASGMGAFSFPALDFYVALFNLRTGYWLENPWFLKFKEEQAKNDATSKIGNWWFGTKERLRAFYASLPTFWSKYLLWEFTGQLSAKTRRIYVSDGGHTGDNLGLLPLLQRKCKTIVVCDFEEDQNYTFTSFDHASRAAYINYGIEIEIDLEQLIPKPDAQGMMSRHSEKSVVVGKIRYNDPENSEGTLYYLKSSISRDPKTQQIPAPILNYSKGNTAFPHQSTADQYFDDEQFEAYRLLGQHIATQAAYQM
jgi:hypothetical protein